MAATCSLSFKQLGQAEIIVFTDNVTQKTGTDPQFTSIKPLVVIVETVAEAYRTAYNLALNNDAVLNLEKDKKLKELHAVLTDLAQGVDGIAKGDIVVIMAAGYEPTKEAKAITSLNTPSNLKVINKIEGGVVYLSWDKVDSKTAYLLQMRVVGTDTWTQIATPSARSITLKDLTQGTHLEFRVCATGTRGLVSNWSAVADVWVS
jgi:hypothetical protein